MPGRQHRMAGDGDVREKLADLLLSQIAFVTQVPRPSDVGCDFNCVLKKRIGGCDVSGPFFTVQVKGKGDLVYTHADAVNWILNQDNPFFVCVVDTESSSMEIYSTWVRLKKIDYEAPRQVILIPGGSENNSPSVDFENGSLRIHLGAPIINIAQDALGKGQNQNFVRILEEWVKLDRENIVRVQAHMYWVVGPLVYKTNEPLSEGSQMLLSFSFHKNNLAAGCLENFGRTATHLRVVIGRAINAGDIAHLDWKQKIETLDNALVSYRDHLEPLAHIALREHTGLDVDRTEGSAADRRPATAWSAKP